MGLIATLKQMTAKAVFKKHFLNVALSFLCFFLLSSSSSLFSFLHSFLAIFKVGFKLIVLKTYKGSK